MGFRKEVLAEFIFSLNKLSSFMCKSPVQSSPCVGFAYNNSLPKEFVENLLTIKMIPDSESSIICILADWSNVAEGIIFTDMAIYLNTPNNTEKKFYVLYKEIKSLKYNPNIPSLVIETNSESHIIDTALWSKRNIHDYLQFAAGSFKFDSKNSDAISAIKLSSSKESIGAIAAGITYGNVSNASSIYFDDKITTPRGHGFAAEHANHLADLYHGNDAQIVGDDNAKNGADRIVNGIQIQSKYCSSGSKCIQECFEDGKFRYWNPDGSPMQVEVPSDMYDSAVQAMEARIQRGEVPGVTDPAEAKNIVRKGYFTYEQAKNIAKAGTVESITFDAASGAIIAANTFGITVVLSFAASIWNGDSIDIALKSSAAQGLKVGGTTFITAVLAGQLSKAGLNSALVSSSEALVGIMGPKASAVLVNALRQGTNIYGAAAMKSAAKLLRGNAITGMVSFVVLSVGDVANIFRGRISGEQLFKNLTNTASTVAGGSAGWVAGATAGAMVGSAIPLIGTAIGGIVGGLAGAFGGGALASKASGAILNQFIEDDAEYLLRIIQDVFSDLCNDYLITKAEAERIVDQLKERLNGNVLKDMYASSNRKQYAKSLMEKYFIEASNKRQHIMLPSQEQMKKGLISVLEDIADENIA